MKKIVTLNSGEITIAKGLGRKRYAYDMEHATRDHQPSSVNEVILSLAGELAFCKIHNVYPDLGWDTFMDADCIVNGYKIDIKTTDQPKGNLLVADKGPRIRVVDYYALMIGSIPTFEYMGIIKFKDTIVTHRRREGHPYTSPCYFVARSELIIP